MAAKSPKPYVKLPGRGRRGWVLTTSFTSLWMATDHLMQVEGTRISEDYKRFYFKDIKAIIMRRTRTWITNTWILLGLAALFMGLFALIAFNVQPLERIGFLVVGGCIAGFFLLCAAINVCLGPTCICHLRTPVQQEELPSLSRIRTATRALKRIRQAVEAVQGPFGPNERAEAAALIAQYEVFPNAPVAIDPHPTSPPPLPGNAPFDSSRWQIGLVAALLATAILEILSVIGIRGALALTLNQVANLAIGGISIALLARLPRHAEKAAAWTRVAVWGVWFAVGGIYGIVGGIRYGMEHPGQQSDIVKIMGMLPKTYFVTMSVAAATYLLWAALEGIALVQTEMRKASQPPTSAATSATTNDPY